MRLLRFLCLLPLVGLLFLLASDSCEQTATPSGNSSAKDSKAESKEETISITIDGRKATSLEEAALRAWLSDAISRAIGKAVSDFYENLGITEQMEMELLGVAFGTEKRNGDELWSVSLIRPGKETKEPRTTELVGEGRPIIRFTRATAPVERPIAVTSKTSIIDGRISQLESFFIYDENGKWREFRPNEHEERIRGDKE